VLWDNGSTDGTAAKVRSAFPQVICHLHDRNLGVASGRNAGARLAEQTLNPAFLLFLDNDMVVTRGFLEYLLEPFEHIDRLAQTEPKIRFIDDATRLNAAGGCRIQFCLGKIEPVGYGETDTGQYDKQVRCIPNGGAMLVRMEIFNLLGGFDSVFDPYGPEDLDFSLRVRRMGYHGMYVPRAVVHHERGRTVEGGEFNEIYARNKTRHWMILMRRHASPLQRLGFYIWGAPIGFLRILIRETLSGNTEALKGLLGGFLGTVIRRRPGS
jgi:GT2 family glycosyltransferase